MKLASTGVVLSFLFFSCCEQAPSSLAGVKNAVLWSAVAAIAVQLAGAVKEGISSGRLYNEGGRFSTKPWQKSEAEASTVGNRHGTFKLRACWYRRGRNGPIWESPRVGRGMCAANCKLILLVFGMFQHLTEQAHQAGVCIPGADPS